MNHRVTPVLVVSLLAALAARPARAQSAPAEADSSAAAAPATTPPLLAAHPQPAPAAATPSLPQGERATSAATVTHLTEGMPGYVPAVPEKPDNDQADSDDDDQPKNKIVRLPGYVVHERPPPIFTQRELYTPKALAELEFKKHPGLNLWGWMPLSVLNQNIALQMADEETRLDNITDLAATAHAVGRGGDASGDEYIKRVTQQTYMHDVWGSNDEGDGK